MCSEELDKLCQTAFAAYNERAGGKTFDGRVIPPWSECGPKVRNNWRAAIAAVYNSLNGEDMAIDYDGAQSVYEEV